MITFGVDNLETAIRFYQDGLGFPKMESPPEVAFFTLNGSWLGLYGRCSLAEDAGVSPEGSGFPGFTLSHNVASGAHFEKVDQGAAHQTKEKDNRFSKFHRPDL
jgi:hypothetical protein